MFAIWLSSLALLFVTPGDGILGTTSKKIVVQGTVLEWIDPEHFVFKVGGKKIEVRAYFESPKGLDVDIDALGIRTKLFRHEVVALDELEVGTQLHVFGRRILWSRSGGTERYHLETPVFMAVGAIEPPRFFRESDPDKPNWFTGQLSFTGDDRSVAWLDRDMLIVGKERPITVIHPMTVEEFKALEKSPKVYLVGTQFRSKDAGTTYSVKRIIIPTRGIPKREYDYVIDPEKVLEDQRERRGHR